jgi:hypothetical protein
MDSRRAWIAGKLQLGRTLLLVGALTMLLGVVAELAYSGSPYNMRIITGLGIMLAGAGIGYLVRYRGAAADADAARRIASEELDERTTLIRARAGNRAYWTSSGFVYLGLMWASFAANGGLPPLAGDVLWWFLAAAFVLPFGVYVASMLVDERTI